MLEKLLLYGILCAASWYLFVRATITSAIWKRYPPWLTKFMDCSSCTGFWWGLFWSYSVGGLDGPFQLPVVLSRSALGHTVDTMPWLVATSMLVVTPIVAGLMYKAYDAIGTVVSTEGSDGQD